jgi:putative endonuclease
LSRSIGQHYENHALDYLKQQGLKLLIKNFHVKGGEIDLVMYEGHTLVFIEVRYRAHLAFGGSIESVTLTKQRRLIFAAQCFLQRYNQLTLPPCRFDLFAIGPTSADISWIKSAFSTHLH